MLVNIYIQVLSILIFLYLPRASIVCTVTAYNLLFMNMAGEELYHIGLVNFQNKYLTAESFGFQVNASGVNLKKKQIWTIEQDSGHVFLKSHLGRYLTADKNGNLSCEAESKETDAKFSVTYQDDGKWALKSQYDRYLGGEDDQIDCFALKVDKAQAWTMQLAIHPQINLLHGVRKRYARLNDEELQVTEDIPWGERALVTLEFKDGSYALLTSDSHYVNSDGSLETKLTEKGRYLIEFHEGRVAFRTYEGRYLTCAGNKGKIQSSKKGTPGRDEHFILVDNHPQFILTAQNERMVSVRQGHEVTANQRFDITDTEIFQMEFDPKKPGKVCMRDKSKAYWVANGDVKASSTEITDGTFFGLEWHSGTLVSFQANSGKYVTIKPNGKLAPTADSVGDKEKFVLQLINRPLLILRGEHGFVGMKGASGRLECNRSSYEVFKLHFDQGKYKLEGRNGKFAQIDDAANVNLTGTSDNCAMFFLEFREHTKMCIKAVNAGYLKGESNGAFTANSDVIGKNTIWEH